MTHITKLTEIVDGRLLPSDKKLSSSLLEVDTGIPEVGAGRLTITGDTLGFDYTGLATESYVIGAIESAQLGGGEVDLSGYATKDEFLTKVDKVEGKGLSTNDYTAADKAKVDGIDTSISTAVNTAIAGVVDSAPTTFDTLKEIATWIETEGVDTAGLAASIAGKADKTEVDGKVDKVAGKGLSTEDFTTAYKNQLDTLEATLVGLQDDVETKLEIPTETDPSTVTTPTVNSIPLYTLGNNGEYVLCTPDTWFLINGFYVPGYSATTLGV